MSIASNIQNAFEHLQQNDFHSALTCTCIALDATGKAEFHTSSERRCRQLVNANLDILTSVGLFNAIYAVPGAKLSLSNPQQPSSSIPLEDIIYKTIRCNLLHEANLPQNIELTNDLTYGIQNGKFKLPVTLIYALLLIVIGAPSNHLRKLNGSPIMTIRNVSLNINTLWGKGTEIRRLLQIGHTTPVPEVDS